MSASSSAAPEAGLWRTRHGSVAWVDGRRAVERASEGAAQAYVWGPDVNAAATRMVARLQVSGRLRPTEIGHNPDMWIGVAESKTGTAWAFDIFGGKKCQACASRFLCSDAATTVAGRRLKEEIFRAGSPIILKLIINRGRVSIALEGSESLPLLEHTASLPPIVQPWICFYRGEAEGLRVELLGIAYYGVPGAVLTFCAITQLGPTHLRLPSDLARRVWMMSLGDML